MNKVKCKNGHYFNLDKFPVCPFCGSSAEGKTSLGKSKKKPELVQNKPKIEDDKTIMLGEYTDTADDSVHQSPAWGNHTWEESGPASVMMGETVGQQSQQVSVKPEGSTLALFGVDDIDRTMLLTEAVEPCYPKKQEQLQQVAGSSLSQAVAATGGGIHSALPQTVSMFDQKPEPEASDGVKAEPVTGWLVGIKGIYRGQSFACRTGRNRIGRNPDCDIRLTKDSDVSLEAQAIIIYDPKGRKFYLQNGEGNGLVYLNGELMFNHTQLQSYDQIQIGTGEYTFIPLCGERFTWEDYLN